MRHILSFRKGSSAAREETDLAGRIRVMANRYASGDDARLLITLLTYTKIPGQARKLSRILDLSPLDYSKAITDANERLQTNEQFRNLFHYIRVRVEDAMIEIPRFPAAPPAF